MKRSIAVLALAAACGPSVGVDPDGESGDGTSSGGSTSTSSTGSTSTDMMSSSSTGSPSTSGDSGGGSDDGYEDDGGTGCTFTCPPPPPPPGGGGGGLQECDLFAQDCPRGEKCMPWANDGGSVWNATKCSPLAPDPAQLGETCNVEGSGVSGIDNCELAAMCWNVDRATNIGYCVDLCGGTSQDPVCPDSLACVWIGIIPMCVAGCDPLANDCPQGQACHPYSADWVCEPMPADAAGANEPCLAADDCQGGLACIAGETIGCAEVGCCAELCDLGGPPPCGGGLFCVPWYADPPSGLEHVGVCVLP